MGNSTRRKKPNAAPPDAGSSVTKRPVTDQGDATGDLSLADIAKSGTVPSIDPDEPPLADHLADPPADEQPGVTTTVISDADMTADIEIDGEPAVPDEPEVDEEVIQAITDAEPSDRSFDAGRASVTQGKVSRGSPRFFDQKNLLADVLHRVTDIITTGDGVTLCIGEQTLVINDPGLARAFGAEHPSINNWLQG